MVKFGHLFRFIILAQTPLNPSFETLPQPTLHHPALNCINSFITPATNIIFTPPHLFHLLGQIFSHNGHNHPRLFPFLDQDIPPNGHDDNNSTISMMKSWLNYHLVLVLTSFSTGRQFFPLKGTNQILPLSELLEPSSQHWTLVAPKWSKRSSRTSPTYLSPLLFATSTFPKSQLGTFSILFMP